MIERVVEVARLTMLAVLTTTVATLTTLTARTTLTALATRTALTLYISQSFVNRYLPLAPDLKRDYIVWIARYGEYKPDVRLAYWQLCPDGHVRGITPEVDINVFNGYRNEYEEFLRNECIK